MKKYLFTLLASLLFIKLNAQEKKIDTIYIRTNVEDVSSKFHSTYQNQYMLGFSFNVLWELHDFKRSTIYFTYLSPKKDGINGWSIFIKDDKEFLTYKNYYTIEQFTKKLKEQDFFLPIFHDKVQLILLYGAKCSSKVELYPVIISTNIASEG